MRRTDLRAIANWELAIKWAQNNWLLNLDPNCTACGSNTTWYATRNSYRCKKTNSQKYISLKVGTLFEKSLISVKNCLVLIYEWAVETPVSSAAYEYSISVRHVRE